MYDKVLLTLDGSELSRSAIPHAIELARGTDTEVIILEVLETRDTLYLQVLPVVTVFASGGLTTEDLVENMHSSRLRVAKRDLEEAESDLNAAGIRVTTTIREGQPGNEIVEAAARLECRAIVMATRGHSGLGREVLGSVAEYVVRHAGPAAVVLVGPRALAGLAHPATPVIGAEAVAGPRL